MAIPIISRFFPRPTSRPSAASLASEFKEALGGLPRDEQVKLVEDVTLGVGIGLGAFGYGIDPDDHLYRRITQSIRELPPVIQDRMLRLSWSLYESNPFAHGIIEMMKDFVVGKGFAVRSADKKVQSVIDRHWMDFVNNWDMKQHDRVRDLSLFGELILVVAVNEANGHVRLASIDPLHIRNVYTEPENPEVVTTIVINPRRKVGGLSDSDRFYRVIYQDEDVASPTYGRLIATPKGEIFQPPGSSKSYRYAGSCFYFTINKVSGAVRGRSDLLSIIDWLDSYDQILFNFVDRTLLMNCFVWDVTVKQATENQLIDWRRKHARNPKPGTVNVHNENETWEAVSPTFQRAEFEVQEKSLRSQILSAVGLPPHWFGEQITTRVSSIEQGSPALKRLSSRQLYIKYLIETIMAFVIDQAIIANVLPVPQKADDESDFAMITPSYPFEVTAPQMSNRDLSQASTSMMSVVQAITIALTAGLVDIEEARKIFVTIAGELGADINLDEMVIRMEQDLENGVDPTGAGVPEDDGSINPVHPARVNTGTINATGGLNPSGHMAGTNDAKESVSPVYPTTLDEALTILREARALVNEGIAQRRGHIAEPAEV